MSDCACGENWIIEACDLRTGTVREVVHPTSAGWSLLLNRFAQGSLSLPSRKTPMRTVWPHLTSIYISRTAGGDATPDNPVCEYAGLVESLDIQQGTTNVGMQSIEEYLWHRQIENQVNFLGVPQTEIARSLVAIAEPNGIPLTARAAASSIARDRTYEKWDKKLIGEAITDLSQVIDGPDWTVEHTKADGRWSTALIFQDHAGRKTDVTVRSDREANTYGMGVDAKNHATHVVGIGTGEEDSQLTSTADDPSGIYPRFDSAPSWQDVSEQETLDEHTQGYLSDNEDPFATPSFGIPGLKIDPGLISLGDEITAELVYGKILEYRGQARVTGISWALSSDAPELRTLELLSTTRSTQAFLNPGADLESECEDC